MAESFQSELSEMLALVERTVVSAEPPAIEDGCKCILVHPLRIRPPREAHVCRKACARDRVSTRRVYQCMQVSCTCMWAQRSGVLPACQPSARARARGRQAWNKLDSAGGFEKLLSPAMVACERPQIFGSILQIIKSMQHVAPGSSAGG